MTLDYRAGHQRIPRLRGRAGVEQRKRRRQQHPLCKRCLEQGRTRATEVIDHEKPLALGGTDTDDNVRGLCADCHRIVTAEQFGHRVKRQIGVDGWPVD